MIALENVGLRYGSGPEILRDLSFTIEPRSFQFLAGPSGAGKTTLMRLMSLSLRPTRGFMSLFDRDVMGIGRSEVPAMRRRLGVVFQDFRLLDHLSTFDNVALPLRIQGRALSSYREDVLELLRWVELEHRKSAFPPVLSGGEKQRAAIARAVVAQPDVLLADEPTGNVDPQLAKRLMLLFKELNKLGTAVVIATHDVALMDEIDARRLILFDGHIQDEP